MSCVVVYTTMMADVFMIHQILRYQEHVHATMTIVSMIQHALNALSKEKGGASAPPFFFSSLFVLDRDF